MEKKKLILWLNLFLLSLFILLITFLTVKYAPGITKLISKPDRFRLLLTSYGPISVLVFIFFQILQVVIAAIPGELVQLAGGYVYGTLLGTIYSTVGILLGSIIAFYISRLLGLPLVKILVPQREFEKFNFLINNPKSEITMFILFLIPGIPKDILVYMAGFTPIKPLKFFVIFAIARFPSLLATSYIGSNIQERDYLPVIIVSVIACVLSVIGILKRDFVIHQLHHFLHLKGRSGKS
jgi:uncharacterized membrane protein YdjX (TVP38/TMEM64 family)